MELSDGISQAGGAYLWAKMGGAHQWHPLAGHLVDAALVGRELWREWLPAATRRWLAEPLGGDEQAAGQFLSLLAGCHDLGKASPAFQVQVEWLAAGVREAGFPLPGALPSRRNAPHSLVSAATITPILVSCGWSPGCIRGVAAILGGHHGWFPAEGFAREPQKRPELYGWSRADDDPWSEARCALFDLIVETSHARAALHALANVDLGRARELTLAGYVVLADWIASNEKLFPYTSRPFEHAYVTEAGRQARAALAGIGWRRCEIARPESGPDWFSSRFGFPPNELQSRTIEVAAAAEQMPGLLLIEAPMGIGKTEAALAAAEVLISRHGYGGLFLGLPTQATSNQMFHRTKQWLRHLDAGTFVLELAHGRALQLKEYRELVLHGGPACVEIDGEQGSVVTAEAWFAGPKRRLLAPFVVGTVDQALMCSAKVRHVALRQVGLAGKVVVIDEVHAYDAHMSVFLRRELRWLGEAGVPVVLLTATLPTETRDRLVEAYAGRPVDLGQVGYPSVTTVNQRGVAKSTVVEHDRRPVAFGVEWLDEALDDESRGPLCARITPFVARGANVLVICNTVARAQQATRALQDKLGEASVTLLHARFTSADRLTKEAWLNDQFGPGGDRPSGHVVVGTQVLEQSLDVDFDLLVTDFAPIDLVLQRMGRVHRHAGITRPVGLEQPVVIVAGTLRSESAPPEFPRGSVLIYGEHLLLRSAAVLESRSAIVVPRDVPALVASVYGEADVVPASWQERSAAAALAWSAAELAREQKAKQFAIPDPHGAASLLELCRIGIGDLDDDDPAVIAAVRDAPATVEVVLGSPAESEGCVRCGEVDVSLDAPNSVAVDAALSCTLRLPPWLTTARLALTVPDGWQKHPWLRDQRLLMFTEAGEAKIGHHRVRYSKAFGLEVIARGG